MSTVIRNGDMGIRRGENASCARDRSYTTARRAAGPSATMSCAMKTHSARRRTRRAARRAHGRAGPRRRVERAGDGCAAASTRAAARCATCASRSPTAAISAASTACRRRCSARDYAFLPQRRAADVRGDHAHRARSSSASACAKIRLTGGEPLLRRNLERLVELLARIRRRRPHADDQRRAARAKGAQPARRRA